MKKIKIIEAGYEIGLGGTEYVMQLFSKYLNKKHFEVLVVGIREGGERVKLIQALGIKVIILHNDMNLLGKLLRETDVFHWHGDGSLNPEIFNVVKENKPKLVLQTNVFGTYDHSSLYDLIDYDLYVSKMILIRRIYADRHLKDLFLVKRKVLYNPVDTEQINSLIPTNEQLQQFKRQHHLTDYFIIGRIGRAAEGKFDFITLDGFAEFAKKVPHARFLLVGATQHMISYATSLHIADRLLVFENTADLQQLLFYYQSMDIFLAASQIGESFGMVIAEAMCAGIPVVTISTPDRDNAQIELVDNEITGLVVERNTEKIAAALFYLYQNEKVRAKLSAASKEKVKKEYSARHLVKSLENLIYHHFNLQNKNKVLSLPLDFSSEIVNDYINRCEDLWPSVHIQNKG